MKPLRFGPAFVCIILFQFMISGCKEDPSGQNPAPDETQSKIKSDQAYLMVEGEMDKLMAGSYSTPSDFDQLKFASALGLYNDALVLNPKNMEAHFGAAITEMLAAYSDPEINKLIKGMDSTGSGGLKKSLPVTNLLSATLMPNTTEKMNVSTMPAAAGVVFALKTAMNDPVLISRVQEVLRDHFLPKVQSAIDHLSTIEPDESFKFVISGKMQGDQRLKSITLYPTEVALLNAMMHFIKFNVQTMLIYKFDLPDYSQASLVAALSQDNTSFFVLQQDGRQRAADAKQTYLTCIGKLRKAVDYLERISGSKPDAIIKLGSGGIRQRDLDTVKSYFTKMESAVTSPLTFKVDDVDGTIYTVSMNLGNLFANPPANPKKDWLPAYSVTPAGTNDIRMQFTAATFAEFNFPDPTFSGLFPAMNQDDLKRLLRIDEAFAFVFEGSVSIQPNDYLSYLQSGIVIALTVNNRTYTTETGTWGDYKLLIHDPGPNLQPITKISATRNGTEYELQNINPGTLPGVKGKTSASGWITLTLAPINLSASKISSPLGVKLDWNAAGIPATAAYNFDYYKTERKTGAGSFTTISPTANAYYLSATDQNVTSGIQYTYRIRTKQPAEYPAYSPVSYTLVPKYVVYSNEAKITP